MRFITVGAGPCGLFASRLLSEMGHEVSVLEEHSAVGEPIQCAGLVGNRFVDMMGNKCVINNIDGAHIYYKNSSMTLARKNVAYVIDRCEFDKSLSEGLKVNLNTKVRRLMRENDGRYKVQTTGNDYFADAVIGADGPASIVRSSFHFKVESEFFTGRQYRVEHELEDDHFVVVDICRPFFSWIIPEGDGIVRLGTIGPAKNIQALKERHNINGKILDNINAPIPIGRSELVRENVFLVGDAGLQTKPLTGGGLYYGLCAGNLLSQAVEMGDPSLYQKLWNESFGKEITFGIKARKIYERLSDRDIEKLFKAISENSTLLENKADFDMHSTALSLLMSSPGLIKILGKNIFSLIKME